MTYAFIIHLVTTFFMCGVCWFVQIVHYPLFKEIAETHFTKYIKENYRTAWIVGPIMLLELGSGLWFISEKFSVFFIINMVWLGIIWLSTFAIQMPLHRKLSKQYNHKNLRLLVRTNWIRTVFWSLRSALLIYYIINANFSSDIF